MAALTGSERYEGVLKSLSWHTGYGFIQSLQTYHLFGEHRDIFFYKSELTGGVRPLIGDRVSFRIGYSEEGQPQAREVFVVTTPGGPPRRRGVNVNPKVVVPPPEVPQAPSCADKPVLHYQGVVRSLRCREGYGFIESPEVTKQFGRDVFVHRRQSMGLSVGLHVAFNIDLNGRGMPQARDVVPIPAPGSAAVPTVNGVEGWFHGVVKSYSWAKGYGFVACAQTRTLFGRDVYLDFTHAHLQPGQAVRFRVSTERTGMPQAITVEPIMGGTARPTFGQTTAAVAAERAYEQLMAERIIPPNSAGLNVTEKDTPARGKNGGKGKGGKHERRGGRGKHPAPDVVRDVPEPEPAGFY
eukprot:TRINITY_DN3386_c0_g1_i1.p1 TRINITY_DN3386_c0_g1~~TRINITY_DN3386_c0_g1_i1.p1  ORF type:complete len:354 (+),score=50.41 TRINITY_DN3386_c0_g1_i1:88-1149(+)